MREPREVGPSRWWAAAVVGGLLLVGGGAWLVWRSAHVATFGWFAYAPLQGATVSWSASRPGLVVGIVLAALGLLLLGGVSGWLLSRRRP